MLLLDIFIELWILGPIDCKFPKLWWLIFVLLPDCIAQIIIWKLVFYLLIILDLFNWLLLSIFSFLYSIYFNYCYNVNKQYLRLIWWLSAHLLLFFFMDNQLQQTWGSKNNFKGSFHSTTIYVMAVWHTCKRKYI